MVGENLNVVAGYDLRYLRLTVMPTHMFFKRVLYVFFGNVGLQKSQSTWFEHRAGLFAL